MIQERANKIKIEDDRSQVVLALDEFQDVANLPVINTILTQARSYKLCLLLAHQNATQIEQGLFETIIQNVGTQFVGKVGGLDAARFGKIWDPTYFKEIESQLTTQEFHHWTARLIAKPGEVTPLPVQFWPFFTPKDKQSDEFLENFIKSQKAKYGYGVVSESLMQRYSSRSNDWLKNISVEHPSHDEWLIYCILRKESELGLSNIVDKFKNGTIHRDVMSDILTLMTEEGKLTKSAGHKGLYSLTSRTKKYFDFTDETIGTAEDIPEMIDRVTNHYITQGIFVCVASQKVRKGVLRTDLVAYDYTTETPISVEVESFIETNSHPQHVKLNMVKWNDLGFSACHVWSKNPKIQDIYEKLTDTEKENVEIFIVP